MKLNIKDFGDAVEKQATITLKNDFADVLHIYNEFWYKFIGHDGKGKPLNIDNIKPNSVENIKRLRLGQWCYILLQNQLFIKLVGNAPTNIKEKDYAKIAKSIRMLFESTHHLYNSIEIVEKFNAENSQVINVSSVDGFKAYRNTLAHNIRPYITISSEINVPKNHSIFKDFSADDRWIWSLDNHIFNMFEFWSLSEHLNFTSQQNKNLLINLIKNSDLILQDVFKGKSITYKDGNHKGTVNFSGGTPVSGSSITNE